MATGLTFNLFGKDVSVGKSLKGVEGKANESTKRIGDHFKHLGLVIGEAFAAEKIFEFGKSAFEIAESAEKTSKQTEAVLKSTGGAAGVTAKDIEELAHTIGGYAGKSDQAVQAGENMLLTFKNIKNGVGKNADIFTQASKTATDLSVAMGIPLTNAMRLVGRAVNDPIQGLSALTRYGITFTDAQKNQIKALVDTGQGMKAQGIILDQLNTKFAGSAAAQATPADKAKASWANLKVEIGKGLLPIVDKLATFITEKVVPVIQSIVGWVKEHKKGFEELGNTIKTVVVGAYQNVILPVINALIPVVKAIIGWIKEHKTGLEEVARVIATIFVTAVKIAIGILKVIIGVVKEVVAIVMFLWHNAIEPAAHGIKVAFHGLEVAFHAVHGTAVNVFDGIKSGIRTLEKVLKPVISAISTAFKGIGAGLSYAWTHVIRPIVRAIESAINHIKSLWDDVTGAVSSVGNFFSGIGSALGFAQGTGFSPAGVATVGELGRERVYLPAGSRVSSHTVTASRDRMSGGGNINLTVELKGTATEVDYARAVATGLEVAVNRLGIRVKGVTV